MRNSTELFNHYKSLVDKGLLDPEIMPTGAEIEEQFGVSRGQATHARTMLLKSGLAKPQIVHGQPLGPISDMVMAFDFLPNVMPRNENGCLLWDAGTHGDGYGRFKLNGRDVQAHQVAYEYRHGPVPEGLELDHVFARGCRSQLCVNHEHLEPVTRSENVRRGHAAKRYMAGIVVSTELDAD
ncbi:HNH endonuclease signature motif containing protein [Streptomyces malaysiensis]|uniref:HNH nuclease domain-containing protein n=1 Tax=Streptomyces malaysiensis TaxID=92644 RepID=A0A2J7Z8G4_STRMQ|nr:HNH endonuclease signature motif containing protein [Streptomyces malaysiensis]PNG96567.1 hypothetical protein SMF913_12592 [Streptomyces malaysiensis]